MGAASAASAAMEAYFEKLEQETKGAYAVAERARAQGHDPEDHVDIPLTKNMAERVVKLISLVTPQLAQSSVAQRIAELEREHAFLDWRVGLRLALEVAQQHFCTFSSQEEAILAGIRIGFAYLTLGIVAAPLEGLIDARIKQRRDGRKYLAVYYAGPVRGAGGTAAATSVILADYVRMMLGLDTYDPSDEEVARYVTEIHDYHERVTNLQYHPTDEEIIFLVRHIPVEINGDPTEQLEVATHKDLPRVETNRIRGGICLVLAEGIAQKAPKLRKRLSSWGQSFHLQWDFLDEFLALQKRIKSHSQRTEAADQRSSLAPNYTYLADLVAGRPILCYPLQHGGFRLRYGRTRTSGFSAAALHPATLHLLDRYIATGTQLKVERPGKAAAITPCDSISGPIVRFADGSVARLPHPELAPLPEVAEILYLGDILVSYGDFSENGHKLVPSGYCEEWWIQDVERASVNLFESLDVEKLASYLELPVHHLNQLFRDPLATRVSFEQAQRYAERLKVPLHPSFTYFWNALTPDDLRALITWGASGRYELNGRTVAKIVLPLAPDHQRAKRALELIGIPHDVASAEYAVLRGDDAACLAACLGLPECRKLHELVGNGSASVLELVNAAAPFAIRDKAGTFIGARMGRPEKAKMRKMAGSPHLLFPVGAEGDRLRSFQSALQRGTIHAQFPLYFCSTCREKTIYRRCDHCGNRTEQWYSCATCGTDAQPRCTHGEREPFAQQDLDVRFHFTRALGLLGLTTYPDLIKGVRGTSNKSHISEHLAKGILRAKHGIAVNKDGTTRYDMTELPLTHFQPREIGTSVERLRELGYLLDIAGKELRAPDQILELKPQDIILPSNENSLDESSKKVIFRIAQFIDELLEKFYHLPPFYQLTREEDLVGHLVIGLAPHISAGLIGRIIGFSDTQGCYAHPLWHAGLRRDCDGDECCVILLLDALLNFSRQYLPDQRGAKTMDSPLVLTVRLIPSEVDDQAQGLDVAWRYPLELYEAAAQYQDPWEVKVDQIRQRINTERQYEQFGYTHPVSSVNMGVKCSAYKILPTMEEKLRGQLALAVKIRAVQADDVARLVIEKHFIRDIKGNLRQFSLQKFRCARCNKKFRRPPLVGTCTACGGKLLFTVSEGSITKYLELSLKLTRDFKLPPYLVQSLEITKRRIESVFGRVREKQSGLLTWVSPAEAPVHVGSAAP